MPPRLCQSDDELRERIRNSVCIDSSSGCWLWLPAKDTRWGYGYLWINHGISWKDGKLVKASRLSYGLFNGEIGRDMQVLHRCDVPACVNPEHLFLGSQSDNMVDCYRKGRHPITQRMRDNMRQNRIVGGRKGKHYGKQSSSNPSR